MKTTHFRIIELPDYQVLLIKDFDNESDGSPVLSITFFLEGIKITQSLGFNDEGKRDKLFDDFSDNVAQKVIDETIAILNE